MTMPNEHMRAIRFGLETLTEAVCDNTLQHALRQRAQPLLQRYPTTAQLEGLLTQDCATLPPEWGNALIDARSYLMDVRRQPEATEALVSSVTVTLRHFPDEEDIKQFLRFPRLREWFEPETSRHGQ